jgi:hypothetical protein
MTNVYETYATNVQKIEFDVTTAEGASRVTIVAGTIAITQSMTQRRRGQLLPNKQSRISFLSTPR